MTTEQTIALVLDDIVLAWIGYLYRTTTPEIDPEPKLGVTYSVDFIHRRRERWQNSLIDNRQLDLAVKIHTILQYVRRKAMCELISARLKHSETLTDVYLADHAEGMTDVDGRVWQSDEHRYSLCKFNRDLYWLYQNSLYAVD